MVWRGTIRRFARWGLTHGPVWGSFAAVLGGLPLAMILDADVDVPAILLVGVIAGLVGGPALGLAVGAVCLAADRAPKWILDAPDYVAVVAVVGIIGGVSWPLLRLGENGLAMGLLGVVLLTWLPAVDAARTAPRLLQPAGMGSSPAPFGVAPDGHAS